MRQDNIKNFQKIVWGFYKKEKRDFPWRRTRNPYFILVSEMMLQQTQVARVEKKYSEFLKIFPTLQELSKAPLSRVLIAWQGLGYNRRALYLHQAAREIVKRYNGKIPRDMKTLQSIKGVGQSTAGGICAFAYNAPVVFIETNIRRIFLYHFFRGKQNISDKELLLFIAKSLDREHPREWYFALMDYGAHLSVLKDNPNKKSKHYAVQSKFKGSKRQIRGKIIRYVIKNKSVSYSMLQNHLKCEGAVLEAIIKQMQKERMVTVKRGKIFLPTM
ncbi:MAG: A/G-specific adenine glycosylase [Parcubacteria group bacterium GW2011_GWC1_41_7]|nr:MAG: A/G-specific adenine glycosylase [Parcubacteria group bacterium GW2011_GWC1_41_7]